MVRLGMLNNPRLDLFYSRDGIQEFLRARAAYADYISQEADKTRLEYLGLLLSLTRSEQSLDTYLDKVTDVINSHWFFDKEATSNGLTADKGRSAKENYERITGKKLDSVEFMTEVARTVKSLELMSR